MGSETQLLDMFCLKFFLGLFRWAFLTSAGRSYAYLFFILLNFYLWLLIEVKFGEYKNLKNLNEEYKNLENLNEEYMN
jgi:hypothetical protein